MPIVRQVGWMRIPGVVIGMPKWITSAGAPSLRSTAEVRSTLPAGAPLQKGLRTFTLNPPSTARASPELSSQSPPPVESSTSRSRATRSSIGATGAFWWRQRQAGIATWCVCMEKASAVLGQARAMVLSISDSSAICMPLPPSSAGTAAASMPEARSSS